MAALMQVRDRRLMVAWAVIITAAIAIYFAGIPVARVGMVFRSEDARLKRGRV